MRRLSHQLWDCLSSPSATNSDSFRFRDISNRCQNNISKWITRQKGMHETKYWVWSQSKWAKTNNDDV